MQCEKPVSSTRLLAIERAVTFLITGHLPRFANLFLTRRDWNIKGEDIYELFGRYGGIRQVRIGTDQKLGTKGTAYIVGASTLRYNFS